MNQHVLIVESDTPEAGVQAEAHRLEQQVRAAGYRISCASVQDVLPFLKKAIAADELPAVVLLGPTLPSPITLARQIRSVWATGHFIFAPHPSRLENMRRELSRAPMIGSYWSLASPGADILVRQIGDAVQTARKRGRLRTTLDRANVQISTPKAVDSVDYRRMALSDHYLASLLTQAQEVIVSLDASNRVVYWSAGASDLSNIAANKAIGNLLSETTLWSATMREYLERIPFATRALKADLWFSLDHSPRLFETVFSAVRDDQGTFIGTSLVMHDVTQRQRQLVAERQARTEAEELGRLKDDFLATLSHELRTPLNAILGYAQLLQTPDFPRERLTAGLAMIERNATHQAELISDLLDISSIVSGKLQLDLRPVRLLEVIDDVVSSLRPSTEAKALRLLVKAETGNDIVNGDRHRLHQVMSNLLTNAIKFTPQGGNIDVTLKQHDLWLQVDVTDTGEGLDPTFMSHMFDRFRQADSSITRRKGGLGLGLAIVKQLVEMHKGTVAAISPGVGLGSTFTIRLPMWGNEPVLQEPPDDVADKNSADFGAIEGLRILIVDDEPDARELVDDLLQSRGACTATAASAHEALEVISVFSPDLLISDIGMPGVDGYQLLRTIRQRMPDGSALPAIALTAFAGQESKQKAFDAGYQNYLAKPFRISELIEVIANSAALADGRSRRKTD